MSQLYLQTRYGNADALYYCGDTDLPRLTMPRRAVESVFAQTFTD
jgi:hypothetical protein